MIEVGGGTKDGFGALVASSKTEWSRVVTTVGRAGDVILQAFQERVVVSDLTLDRVNGHRVSCHG